MTITAWFMTLELHMNAVFINMGYARASTFNSFLTGLGVDVVCNYFFLYRWGWGVQGAALAQMSVKISRVLVWIALMLFFGETKTFLGKAQEPLLSRMEMIMFVRLSTPMIISNFSSWFVFELQIMGLANIAGISAPALAAGAIWVQCESTIASIQSGWILSTRIRTLNLLGKRDPGAPRSFAMLCLMSTFLVACLNVPLLLFPDQVAQVVSNEVDVQQWFSDALWVLVAHSQSRVTSLNATCLFLGMGHSTVGVLLNFVCFYCIASPIAGVVALTDLVTTSVRWKIIACVGTTSLAQIMITCVGYGYLMIMNWDKAGKLIQDRANNDRLDPPEMIRRTSAEQMPP
jgi:Na+-driven multidrug efflux pump